MTLISVNPGEAVLLTATVTDHSKAVSTAYVDKKDLRLGLNDTIIMVKYSALKHTAFVVSSNEKIFRASFLDTTDMTVSNVWEGSRMPDQNLLLTLIDASFV